MIIKENVNDDNIDDFIDNTLIISNINKFKNIKHFEHYRTNLHALCKIIIKSSMNLEDNIYLSKHCESMEFKLDFGLLKITLDIL